MYLTQRQSFLSQAYGLYTYLNLCHVIVRCNEDSQVPQFVIVSATECKLPSLVDSYILT